MSSEVNVKRVEKEIGGRVLSIETGKLAKQASAAVTVRYGDTIVLTTTVSSSPRPGIDFFPLTVDYREKTSAAGKFPGGFFKRDGRPTNKEILTMRMIDRPARHDHDHDDHAAGRGHLGAAGDHGVQSLPGRRAGGLQPRPAPGPHRGPRLRRRGLHEPLRRPPGLSQDA